MYFINPIRTQYEEVLSNTQGHLRSSKLISGAIVVGLILGVFCFIALHPEPIGKDNLINGLPSELRSNGRSGFRRFKKCLRHHGYNSSSIVERSLSEVYTELNYQWLLNPPMKHPLAYLLPQTEEQVLAAVVCGQKLKISVVPRCGGHSFEKYSYGDTNSVVVDLRKINQVVLQSTTAAEVGPGASTGEISAKLWKLGKLFIPVGACPTVGISGLATGGGYGVFDRSYGLTVDSIAEINIVTAIQGLITVNVSVNSDLFWALRGAGAVNYGIITKFIFRPKTAPPHLFEGILNYDLGSFEQVYKVWQSSFVDARRSISGRILIANKQMQVIFYDTSGSSQEYQNVMTKFPNSISGGSNTTYSYADFLLHEANNLTLSKIVLENVQELENLRIEYMLQEFRKTKSFFAQHFLDKQEIRALYEILETIPDNVKVLFVWLGGAIDDLGQDETAFCHRTGRHFRVEVWIESTSNSISASYQQGKFWVESFFHNCIPIYDHKESYQNFVDADLVDYLTRYYGHNVDKLIEIKRKYDPDNYFHSPQSIPTN